MDYRRIFNGNQSASVSVPCPDSGLVLLRSTWRAVCNGTTSLRFKVTVRGASGHAVTSGWVTMTNGQWYDYSGLVYAVLGRNGNDYTNEMLVRRTQWPCMLDGLPMDYPWPDGWGLTEETSEWFIDYEVEGGEVASVYVMGCGDTAYPKIVQDTNEAIPAGDQWPLPIEDNRGEVWIASTAWSIYEQDCEGMRLTPDTPQASLSWWWSGIDSVLMAKISGVSPAPAGCEQPTSKKPMVKVRYLRTDLIAMQRWAEVVGWEHEYTRSESIQRQMPLEAYHNLRDFPWYSQTKQSGGLVLTIQWAGLSVSEMRRIADGLVISPWLLVIDGSKHYYATLLDDEGAIEVTEGEPLEVSLRLTPADTHHMNPEDEGNVQ